jgi:hypothetical protein
MSAVSSRAENTARDLTTANFRFREKWKCPVTEWPCCFAVAIERLRGPSARCASLGMTCSRVAFYFRARAGSGCSAFNSLLLSGRQ